MANQWFRMYGEFANDPKVQMMSEPMQRRLAMLFCINSMKANKPSTDEEIARSMHISVDDALETRVILARRGVACDDWTIPNWERHQKKSDTLRPPMDAWRTIRSRIFERDNYTCQYCGEYGKRLECDHVVPVSRGGSNEDRNLVTACFSCNRSKRAKLLSEWDGFNG